MPKFKTILLLAGVGLAAAYILRPRPVLPVAGGDEGGGGTSIGGTTFSLQAPSPGVFNLGAPNITLPGSSGGGSAFDFASAFSFLRQSGGRETVVVTETPGDERDAFDMETFLEGLFSGAGETSDVDSPADDKPFIDDVIDEVGEVAGVRFNPFDKGLVERIRGQNRATPIDDFDEGGGFGEFTGDGTVTTTNPLVAMFRKARTQLTNNPLADFEIPELPADRDFDFNFSGFNLDNNFDVTKWLESVEARANAVVDDLGEDLGGNLEFPSLNPFDGLGGALSDVGQGTKYVAVGATGLARAGNIATKALPFVAKGAFPILSKFFVPLLVVDIAATGAEFALQKNIPVIGNRELIQDVFD